MAATTVTTRAVKGSALSHTEMDTNWNRLNNVGVGVGHISMWPMPTTPDSTWLPCEGGSYATASYPDLFSVIGYSYGGSGANFNVPDFRGIFPRGWANGSGRDPDRSTRTNRGDGTTGDAVGTNQAFSVSNYLAQAEEAGGGGPQSVSVPANGDWSPWMANGESGGGSVIRFRNAGAGETRPINMYVRFIIKALL